MGAKIILLYTEYRSNYMSWKNVCIVKINNRKFSLLAYPVQGHGNLSQHELGKMQLLARLSVYHGTRKSQTYKKIYGKHGLFFSVF